MKLQNPQGQGSPWTPQGGILPAYTLHLQTKAEPTEPHHDRPTPDISGAELSS